MPDEDFKPLPTVTAKLITEDAEGVLVPEPFIAISIDGSRFVPFDDVKRSAELMEEVNRERR